MATAKQRAQHNKLRTCAKRCKGKGRGFKGCMRSCLKKKR
jgi:hypothetical protein